MTDGQRTIESAIAGADSLHKVLKGHSSNQVTSEDEKQIIKATAHAWFNNHRAVVSSFLGEDQLKAVDDFYRFLLASAARATLRSRYLATLKEIRKKLGALQADHVVLLSKAPTPAAAPRDKNGKTLPLKEWGLKNYIDVAHELGWITTTAKDIGEVLRDYRNYIHPQKELSHGISLGPADADMLWNIAKSITLQILKL